MNPIEKQLAEQVFSKYNDILVLRFEQIPPRTTLCHLIFKYQYPPIKNTIIGEDGSRMHAYGVAVRTNTDKEDEEIGKSLALKRAIKSYLKKKREEYKPIKKKKEKSDFWFCDNCNQIFWTSPDEHEIPTLKGYVKCRGKLHNNEIVR